MIQSPKGGLHRSGLDWLSVGAQSVCRADITWCLDHEVAGHGSGSLGCLTPQTVTTSSNLPNRTGSITCMSAATQRHACQANQYAVDFSEYDFGLNIKQSQPAQGQGFGLFAIGTRRCCVRDQKTESTIVPSLFRQFHSWPMSSGAERCPPGQSNETVCEPRSPAALHLLR